MYIQNINKCINRVERTAKLTGISGSVDARNNIASRLNKRLFLMIDESINQRVKSGGKAYITKNEIGKHLKKLAEGVVLFLEKCEDSKLEASVCCEQVEGQINSVYGHVIALPFIKNGNTEVLRQDKVYIASHELRHFFDGVTQPRTLAIENRFARVKHMPTHWNFYEENIYVDYPDEIDKAKIIPDLKNKIDNYFSKHKTTYKDKIVTLQYWRYCMQFELNAMKDDVLASIRPEIVEIKSKIKRGDKVQTRIEGADLEFDSENYSTKKERLKGLLKYNKANYNYNVETCDNENYFFSEKIKLLEQLIVENISKVRTRHKSSIEPKNKTI